MLELSKSDKSISIVENFNRDGTSDPRFIGAGKYVLSVEGAFVALSLQTSCPICSTWTDVKSVMSSGLRDGCAELQYEGLIELRFSQVRVAILGCAVRDVNVWLTPFVEPRHPHGIRT